MLIIAASIAGLLSQFVFGLVGIFCLCIATTCCLAYLGYATDWVERGSGTEEVKRQVKKLLYAGLGFAVAGSLCFAQMYNLKETTTKEQQVGKEKVP